MVRPSSISNRWQRARKEQIEFPQFSPKSMGWQVVSAFETATPKYFGVAFRWLKAKWHRELYSK